MRVSISCSLALVLMTACLRPSEDASHAAVSGLAPLSTAVASVSINIRSAQLKVAETLQLQAQPRNLSGAITGATSQRWDSTAPLIATVSGSGLVTAVSVGVARIRATVDGSVAESEITVIPATAARR